MLRVREAKEGVVHISLKNQNFDIREYYTTPSLLSLFYDLSQ